MAMTLADYKRLRKQSEMTRAYLPIFVGKFKNLLRDLKGRKVIKKQLDKEKKC